MNVNHTTSTIQRLATQTLRQRVTDKPQLQENTNTNTNTGKPKGPHRADPKASTTAIERPAVSDAVLPEADLDALVGEIRDDLNLPPSEDATNPVQALLDAWGTESTEHDLNADGTVNMFDLLELLQQMSQQPQPDADPAPAADDAVPVDLPVVQESVPAKQAGDDYQTRLQELLDAWGTDDANSDINGDGIVDVFDLTELMSQHMAAAQAESDASVNSSVEAGVVNDSLAGDITSVEPQPEQLPLTVDNLLNAWGVAGGQFDLNDDGTVNMFDLLALLNQITEDSRKDPPTSFANKVDDASLQKHEPKRVVRERVLDRIADRLVAKFNDRGFDTKPPANLDATLTRLNFGEEQQALLKQRIFARYPIGGSFNATV